MTYSNQLDTHYLSLAQKPISQTGFAGEDARYSPEYEQLEHELNKTSRPHETGGIDWAKICQHSETLLSEQSKDIRVVCWLTWGLFQQESFAGLHAGINMLHDLCERHWSELHPRRAKTRAAAINWLLPRLEQALTEHTPDDEQRPLLQSLIKLLKKLDDTLSQHLEADAPALMPIWRRLDNQLKQAGKPQNDTGPVSAAIAQVKQVATQIISGQGSTIVTNDREAHKALRSLQDQARPLTTWWLKQKTADIKALRLSRTLLWLNIETLPEHSAEQITALRGIPADKIAGLMDRLKQNLHSEALFELETSIARAPFWLDGQRLVWECLKALDIQDAMCEVELQLALFLNRLPGLENLRYHDGTPFADAETQAWIGAHVSPHLHSSDLVDISLSSSDEAGGQPCWENALQEAMAKTRQEGLKEAIQPLKAGLEQARSGRERFFWQLTLARLCFHGKKYDLARIQLETLDQQLQRSGLDAWEPQLALDVIKLLHGCYELLPRDDAHNANRDEIHRRLCHLDLEMVLD